MPVLQYEPRCQPVEGHYTCRSIDLAIWPRLVFLWHSVWSNDALVLDMSLTVIRLVASSSKSMGYNANRSPPFKYI